MKLLFVPALAGLIFLLAGCFTPTGGSPFNGYVEAHGFSTVSYDLNTLIVVADGEGTAILRDATTKVSLYPPFVWSGRGIWVKIRSDDSDEEYSERFDYLEAPDITVLPAWLERYFLADFTQGELTSLRIAFAPVQ